MARRFPITSSGSINVDFSRLQTLLVNSQSQNKDNPLYQVVENLIAAASAFQASLNGKLGNTDKIDAPTQIQGLVPISNGGVYTNRYVPALDLVTNLDSATVEYLYYTIAGNFVHIFGKIVVDPTAAAATELGISLPFKSYLMFDYDCSGTGSCPTIAGEITTVLADVVNQRASMQWIATNTSAYDVYFRASYLVRAQQ